MWLLWLLLRENCIDTFVLNRTSASGLLPWGLITARVSGRSTILSITSAAASHWRVCKMCGLMPRSLAHMHRDCRGVKLLWRGNGTNLLLNRSSSKCADARVA